MKYKMVKVSEKTHAELIKRAKWGDSMDDIISDLLHVAKRQREEVTK
jgi:hypothetical protein